MMKYCQEVERVIEDLKKAPNKKVPLLEKKLKALEDQVVLLEGKNNSWETLKVEQEKEIARLLTRAKECDEHVVRTSHLEDALKKARADLKESQVLLKVSTDNAAEAERVKSKLEAELAELKEKLKTADDNVEGSQVEVNKMESCIYAHARKCPEILDECAMFLDKPDDAFHSSVYKPYIPSSVGFEQEKVAEDQREILANAQTTPMKTEDPKDASHADNAPVSAQIF